MAVICGQDNKTVNRFANGVDRCAACGERLEKGNRSRIAIVSPSSVVDVAMCRTCARKFMDEVAKERGRKE